MLCAYLCVGMCEMIWFWSTGMINGWTPDADHNEDSRKLNIGRHAVQRASLSLFHMLICRISIMKPPHLYEDQSGDVCPWGQFLSNRIKTNRQFDTLMSNEIPGMVRWDSKQNIYCEGVTLFFDEDGENQELEDNNFNVFAETNGEHIELSLNGNNLVLFRGLSCHNPSQWIFTLFCLSHLFPLALCLSVSLLRSLHPPASSPLI